MIMTDFNKILNKAKELETKMKESQEKIKNIQVQGISGANSVKVTLNGDGEMVKLEISPEIIKEEKTISRILKKIFIIFNFLNKISGMFEIFSQFL